MLHKKSYTQIAALLCAAGLITTAWAGDTETAAKDAETKAKTSAAQLMSKAKEASGEAVNEGKSKAEELRSQLMEVQQTYLGLQREMAQTREKAMERDSVKEAVSSTRSTIKSEMIEAAPDKEEQINTLFSLQDTLSELNPRDPSVRENHAEEIQQFQQLNQQLSSVQQQISTNPEVQQAEQNLRQEMTTAMEEINPKISEVMAQQQELAAKFQHLKAQYDQISGGMQQGRPPMPGQ